MDRTENKASPDCVPIISPVGKKNDFSHESFPFLLPSTSLSLCTPAVMQYPAQSHRNHCSTYEDHTCPILIQSVA